MSDLEMKLRKAFLKALRFYATGKLKRARALDRKCVRLELKIRKEEMKRKDLYS